MFNNYAIVQGVDEVVHGPVVDRRRERTDLVVAREEPSPRHRGRVDVRQVHAVAAVVAEGAVRTYDMMKLTGGPDVFKKGAATTAQMTDAVIANL